MIGYPISPKANPSCVVETENPEQYHGKLDKVKINNSVVRRTTKLKTDSTLTVINKLRIFCDQYELAKEAINVKQTNNFFCNC